jgi:hypothetical protein
MPNKYLYLNIDGSTADVLVDNSFHDEIHVGDIVYIDSVPLFVISSEETGDFKTIDTIADYVDCGYDTSKSSIIVIER